MNNVELSEKFKVKFWFFYIFKMCNDIHVWRYFKD